MSEENGGPQRRRSFPAVYEKLIPIALGVIIVLVLLVLTVAAAIALRILPGASY